MNILGSAAMRNYSAQILVGACLLVGMPAAAQGIVPGQPIQIASSISLREGSRGAMVAALQRRLDQNGLFPYAIDGYYGPATVQAVRQFQRIRRLPVTGVADPQTLEQLDVSVSGFRHPVHGFVSEETLTPGSVSADVRVLQSVLRSFGFGVAVDGDYGDNTRRSVRAYQRTAGLPVTGSADRETLIHMGFEPVGDQASDSRYVAAIIANPEELSAIRRDFPSARPDISRQGSYISIGRFDQRSRAAARTADARRLGYDARVIVD